MKQLLKLFAGYIFRGTVMLLGSMIIIGVATVALGFIGKLLWLALLIGFNLI